MGWVKNIFKRAHIHRWDTTHANKWQHATRQECKCGMSRSFAYKINADDIKGMPWDKGDWLYSDGTRVDYNKSRQGFYFQN